MTKKSSLGFEVYELDTKYPMLFALFSLIFIYVFQYPLSQLISDSGSSVQYDWEDWLFAYTFVIFSSAILLASLSSGMSGTAINIYVTQLRLWKSDRRVGLLAFVAWFAFFMVWTFLMLKLKVGMTFYTDFDPLPFKLVGLLVYGRLFVQPLILAYLARGYATSRLKWIVFPMFILLGGWVSLASGSRFAGIAFALPMLLLFTGKSKYVAFSIAVLTNITIASLTRNFFLPFVIGGEYIDYYTNEDYQASLIDNLFMLPFAYAIGRSMGMAEVLMTLRFGDITPSFGDSVFSLLSYFLPFVPRGDSFSIKNVYGLDDDSFGGYGLDLFSNYWVFFGGTFLLYIIGLILLGWMLGKTYRLLTIALVRFGFREGSILIFVLLFILVFEGRGFLLSGLLIIAYLLSREGMLRIVHSITAFFSKRRTRPWSESRSLNT